MTELYCSQPLEGDEDVFASLLGGCHFVLLSVTVCGDAKQMIFWDEPSIFSIFFCLFFEHFSYVSNESAAWFQTCDLWPLCHCTVSVNSALISYCSGVFPAVRRCGDTKPDCWVEHVNPGQLESREREQFKKIKSGNTLLRCICVALNHCWAGCHLCSLKQKAVLFMSDSSNRTWLPECACVCVYHCLWAFLFFYCV